MICIEFYNNKDLLQYAIENDMINLSHIKDQVEMMERKKLLDLHQYQVWQGKDGKWRTYFPDENRKRVMRKRSTKKELEDLICDYWKEKTENPTIHDVFTQWINKKLEFKEIQQGSADRYETDFRRFFVKSKFSETHIKDIQEDDIEQFIRTQIVEHDLTSKTFSGLRIIIKGIFQYAKKRKWTSISISEFFGDLDISRNTFHKKIKDKNDEVLSEAEVPIIVQYLKSDPTVWNLGVLLVLQTGVRVGELSALKPEDWDGGDILKIRRTEVRLKINGKNTVMVKEFAKTEAGVRDVILTDGGKETLRRLINRNPNGKYLFENSSGIRIRGNTFNKRLDTVLKHLNLHHRSIHKLRKTYCTMLIDSGCEDSVIMNQLGHASIETSRKYYYFCNRTKKHQTEQVQKAITI